MLVLDRTMYSPNSCILYDMCSIYGCRTCFDWGKFIFKALSLHFKYCFCCFFFMFNVWQNFFLFICWLLLLLIFFLLLFYLIKGNTCPKTNYPFKAISFIGLEKCWKFYSLFILITPGKARILLRHSRRYFSIYWRGVEIIFMSLHNLLSTLCFPVFLFFQITVCWSRFVFNEILKRVQLLYHYYHQR